MANRTTLGDLAKHGVYRIDRPWQEKKNIQEQGRNSSAYIRWHSTWDYLEAGEHLLQKNMVIILGGVELLIRRHGLGSEMDFLR